MPPWSILLLLGKYFIILIMHKLHNCLSVTLYNMYPKTMTLDFNFSSSNSIDNFSVS